MVILILALSDIISFSTFLKCQLSSPWRTFSLLPLWHSSFSVPNYNSSLLADYCLPIRNHHKTHWLKVLITQEFAGPQFRLCSAGWFFLCRVVLLTCLIFGWSDKSNLATCLSSCSRPTSTCFHGDDRGVREEAEMCKCLIRPLFEPSLLISHWPTSHMAEATGRVRRHWKGIAKGWKDEEVLAISAVIPPFILNKNSNLTWK